MGKRPSALRRARRGAHFKLRVRTPVISHRRGARDELRGSCLRMPSHRRLLLTARFNTPNLRWQFRTDRRALLTCVPCPVDHDDALRPARARHRDDALRRPAHPRRGDASHQGHDSAQPPAFVELHLAHALRAHALPDTSRRAPRLRPIPALRRAVCVPSSVPPCFASQLLPSSRAVRCPADANIYRHPNVYGYPTLPINSVRGPKFGTCHRHARACLLDASSHCLAPAAAAQGTSSSRHARRTRVVRSFSCAATPVHPHTLAS